MAKRNDGITCRGCGIHYNNSSSGALDLRLRNPKEYNIAFELGRPLFCGDLTFETLRRNSSPEVDFSNVKAPYHLTSETLS